MSASTLCPTCHADHRAGVVDPRCQEPDAPRCLSTPPIPGCNCGLPVPTAPLARCRRCDGLGRVPDAPCDDCNASGYLPACLNCAAEPRDPLFAPCCSGACREEWEAKEKRARRELGLPPAARRAP